MIHVKYFNYEIRTSLQCLLFEWHSATCLIARVLSTWSDTKRLAEQVDQFYCFIVVNKGNEMCTEAGKARNKREVTESKEGSCN